MRYIRGFGVKHGMQLRAAPSAHPSSQRSHLNQPMNVIRSYICSNVFDEPVRWNQAMYMNVLMSSSSRRMYLFSISHSSCSLIIFFEGRNIFFRISINSACKAALFSFLRIFMILMIASCVRRMRSCTMDWLSSCWDRSVLSCKRPIKLI